MAAAHNRRCRDSLLLPPYHHATLFDIASTRVSVKVAEISITEKGVNVYALRRSIQTVTQYVCVCV